MSFTWVPETEALKQFIVVNIGVGALLLTVDSF